MAIGSHGMRHRDWRKLDDDALDDEISEARARIADVCGRPVRMASIPFGSYDRRVLARLRREDLDCVHTSDGGLARSGAWLKPRESLDVQLVRAGHRASCRRVAVSAAAAPRGDALQGLALE